MMLILGTVGAQAQRYDRGYENLNSISTVFAPKGSFMLGGNLRYSHHSMNDYSVLVINGINSKGSTISASPSFLYMVKDNMGLGARFSYNRSHFDLESANLSVSEISMSVQDYFRLSQSYTGMILFRPYIPLGPGGRFSMFAELNLGASFSQSKNTVDISSVVKGSFVEKYKIWMCYKKSCQEYPGLLST